jgi:hypothetical protein
MPRQSTPARTSASVSTKLPAFYPTTPTSVTHHVEQPTLGQSIKQGFGFGVGTSIARNVVDRMFAGPSASSVGAGGAVTSLPPKKMKTCKELEAEFNHCIQAQLPENTCQDFMDRYNQCKQ